MALSYSEQYDLSQDQVFRHKCLVAIATIARQVLLEDPATPNHVNRVQFARNLVSNSDQWVPAVSLGVATYPGILTNASDAEIQNAVSYLFNLYAGF